MKSLLKKLSRADRPDRREQLEDEAAERIREVGGQAPPEAYASSWAASTTAAAPLPTPSTHSLTPDAPAPAAPAPAAHTGPLPPAHTLAPTAPVAQARVAPAPAARAAPAGRRLTVQERLAARELQSR